MAQVVNKNCSPLMAAMAVMVFAILAGSSATAQTVKSGIQRMSGWQSCAACAGAGGAGPSASVSSSAGISSPSMSGSSRVFSIASGKSFANALWWKQLGAANGATNLVYDVWFYLKAPQNSQALEFDSNQANGHMRWIFGTQCNIAAGVWDVYGNASGGWKSTGIHCGMPSAYKWHHLVWEFKRSSSSLTFVAVTIDGAKHYVNRTYGGKSSGTNELNVAFQMDMKANHVSYQSWLDNVTLKYW